MKKQKPKTPYQHLIETCRDWADTVVSASERTAYIITATRLHEGFVLSGVAERVQAADQLGWDVILRFRSDGTLAIVYRKRPTSPPWQIAL